MASVQFRQSHRVILPKLLIKNKTNSTKPTYIPALPGDIDFSRKCIRVAMRDTCE